MKWLVFGAAVACVPFLAMWFRHYPDKRPLFWAVFGSLPFVLSLFERSEIAFISWPGWPGIAKGVEVSLLDLIAIAIYVNLPRFGPATPFRLAIILYLAAVLVSSFAAQVPMAAFFYLWQLARVFLLYAVVARASAADDRVIPAVLKGMALGLVMEAGVVVWDRFALGAVQAAGTFFHQNMLGMASHFVVFPLFALLLAGERGRLLQVLAVLAGAVIAVGSASRATIALVGLGFIGLFALSAFARWSGRKARVGVVGLVAMLVFAGVALSSLERRFIISPLEEEYDERKVLITAAEAMVSDRPLGVGANNYAVVSNTQGYADRAGLAHSWSSRAALVHNIYWLALAETGYFGLLALLFLLSRPLVAGLRAGWKHRRNKGGELMLGLTTSIAIVYIHSYYEWIFFHVQVQYFYAITMGMIAGLAHQLGYWARSPRLSSRISERPRQKIFAAHA